MQVTRNFGWWLLLMYPRYAYQRATVAAYFSQIASASVVERRAGYNLHGRASPDIAFL